MRTKCRLKEFESYIRTKARRFARRPDDVDDFIQEGRLAAWQALQDDPKATKSYVHQRISWRVSDFATRRIYKNPEEISANESFGHILWGDAIADD